jgi:hypothetical protein
MPHPWTVHVGDCGARREADGEGVTDLEFSESAFQHAAWPETTPSRRGLVYDQDRFLRPSGRGGFRACRDANSSNKPLLFFVVFRRS